MCLKICFPKKDSDYSCKDYKEYEIKLKCIKNNIHRNYIVGISAGIVIWMLASGTANSSEFSSWISFASTITSIILSVIAIFMSITGENKTDAIRDKIEETVKKLEEVTETINEANTQNVENIKELGNNIATLQIKIDLLQGSTNELYSFYKESNNARVKVINAMNKLEDWRNNHEGSDER